MVARTSKTEPLFDWDGITPQIIRCGLQSLDVGILHRFYDRLQARGVARLLAWRVGEDVGGCRAYLPDRAADGPPPDLKDAIEEVLHFMDSAINEIHAGVCPAVDFDPEVQFPIIYARDELRLDVRVTPIRSITAVGYRPDTDGLTYMIIHDGEGRS